MIHGRGFSRETKRDISLVGETAERGEVALCTKRRGSAGRMSHKASGGDRLGGRLELALRAKGTTEWDNVINLRLWDHGKPHDGGKVGVFCTFLRQSRGAFTAYHKTIS